MYLKYLEGILFLVLHLYNRTHASNNVNIWQQKSILTSIDNTTQPCDNFYEYACGNYAQQHPSNTYQEITGLIDHQYNKLILNLIESGYQQDSQVPLQCQSFVEKTRTYLNACLSESKRNTTKYFEEIKPGPELNWPILEKVARNKSLQWPGNTVFELSALLGKLQSYGLNNVLINQEILVDEQDQYSIILEPAYAENNTTLPDLHILHVLAIGLGVKNPKRIVNDLVKTNTIFMNILTNYGNQKVQDLPITYSELPSQYPNLKLDLYLKELVGRDLASDTFILIRNPLYFHYLNENLWQVFRKPSLCNYLMMKFLFYLAVDSTASFKPIDCVKDVRRKMDLSVNFLYQHHSYSSKARLVNIDIEKINRSITKMFDKYLRSNRLNFTMAQTQYLLDKLWKIRVNIGNLPVNATFDMVNNFYANVPDLDKNNYYKNHLLLLKHRFLKSFNYAQTQTHFIVTDNEVGSMSGPFYSAKHNMIVLPYASLEKPFYDVRYDDLYKYSLLGFVLAHEFAHAFDTSGVNIDSRGEVLQQNSGILENVNFQSSIECLQSQLTTENIDERIADILALEIVYKIYISKHNNLQPESMNDPRNNYFFLNLAQFFCGKSNLKFIDHDTDAERLNQIVMNSEAFALSFRCPESSPMNPSKKCRLY